MTDFCLNVGGILLATTLYASAPAILLALLLAPCLCILVVGPRKPGRAHRTKSTASNGHAGKVSEDKKDADGAPSDFPVRPFLTAYRGAMMVVTCHAILAVDFRVFPRRFAKVETWGTSVMDMGVGSFVFSAGVVAAKGHLKARREGTVGAGGRMGFAENLVRALRHALPLLALGIVRLVSVKNLDYAEHVSEYGVHWNFFFTLALLPLMLASLQPILSVASGPIHGAVGIVLALVYETVLQTTSLKAWALTAPRANLLAKNKEGVVSWVGYLAIFLLGMETGTLVLPESLSSNSLVAHGLRQLGLLKNATPSRSSRMQLLAALAASSALYAGLLLVFLTPSLSSTLSIPVSRRLANAPYVFWVVAFNVAQILLFAVVETALFPAVHLAVTPEAEWQATQLATSRVLGDFNAGGLLLFLAANLGTGAVNMGIKTLDVPNVGAVGVLMVYMAALTALARLLRSFKIKV